jgi:TonB family protein
MRVRFSQTGTWAALAALSFALFTAASPAQVTTEAAIAARLVKKPIYLRGGWKEDTLRFDSDGGFFGDHPTGSFTLAAMDVTGVALDKEKAVITGNREVLEFLPAGPSRITLGVLLTVVITAPANGDFEPALNKIFADGLPDLTPSVPDFWQPYMQKTFLPDKASATAAAAPPTGDDAPKRIGGDVTAPVLLKHPEVRYTDMGRSLQYSGSALLHAVVRKDGSVGDIHVARPIGLGLDEAAMAAVSHYTYKPARQNGAPVAVEMDIEVNCAAKPY